MNRIGPRRQSRVDDAGEPRAAIRGRRIPASKLNLLGTVALPFEFLCPRQLVLGDRAFQVIRRWVSGATVVEIHIPYANIKEVVYVVEP